MTISYSKEVATSSFSCFLKLLSRWRGSIYKLLWKDFILFAVVYFALSFSYRFGMNSYQRSVFEMISNYCESNTSRIPVAFILGFYVSIIMTRWWNQLGLIPWPDHIAMFVTGNVHGRDERGRMLRRTLVRYICLAFTLTMSCISPAVKKRFPTDEHFVQAGIMTKNELEILNKLPNKYGNFFIPLTWAANLVTKARREERIKDDFALKTINDEINEVRRCLATLMVYDWISIPLVYTQVVTWAVYTFFVASLMGKQFLNGKQDMFFPLFTFLEYFFYMGWLKVAECLVNPFGEDEDDFDINFLIDRNLHVAYTIVDDANIEYPDIVKDVYWNDKVIEMPYTVASEPFRIKHAFRGSAMDLTLTEQESNMILPSDLDGDDLMNNLDEGGKHDRKSMANLRRVFSRQQSSSYAFKQDEESLSDLYRYRLTAQMNRCRQDNKNANSEYPDDNSNLTNDISFSDRLPRNKSQNIPMRRISEKPSSRVTSSYLATSIPEEPASPFNDDLNEPDFDSLVGTPKPEVIENKSNSNLNIPDKVILGKGQKFISNIDRKTNVDKEDEVVISKKADSPIVSPGLTPETASPDWVLASSNWRK